MIIKFKLYFTCLFSLKKKKMTKNSMCYVSYFDYCFKYILEGVYVALIMDGDENGNESTVDKKLML